MRQPWKLHALDNPWVKRAVREVRVVRAAREVRKHTPREEDAHRLEQIITRMSFTRW